MRAVRFYHLCGSVRNGQGNGAEAFGPLKRRSGKNARGLRDRFRDGDASGLKKGFTDPEDLEGKAEAYALVRRMSDALKAEHGSILCRELLGLPEGVEREDSARPQERTPE